MADTSPKNTSSSDEIDLGQLLHMIGKAFNRLGIFFLRVFLFFKKNAIVLGILIAVGLGISFVLSTLGNKKLKTEAIVRPNFDSTDYVYDVVDEIQSNILSKDTAFFKKIDVAVEDLEGFRVEIEPIKDPEEAEAETEQRLSYLELLQSFSDEGFAIDIMRSELTKKSVEDHRITFSYIDHEKGSKAAEKLLDYINDNGYYKGVIETFRDNALTRIDQNKVLIDQIDQLVANYTQTLLNKEADKTSASVYMENESALNISALLTLKNRFVKEIEEKRLDLASQGQLVSVLNMGKPQVVRKPFVANKFFLIPLAMVVLFFLVSFVRFMNRKARELQL
ncbi:hypothetical protein [Pseudozobellia thermophila]|uniref:Chain length determinant protein n=1 Tax=Pseudozobellia thermophila TaxID=192903 RepID=A0A1M6BLJ0_9FLAO|nr:hypothetical protein [Pseudozobellia thermophila]SHI49428.1 hypothetical protein SAMN04488513_101460 [Pseudozobellia thermophila]